jgi:hypothetical protein
MQLARRVKAITAGRLHGYQRQCRRCQPFYRVVAGQIRQARSSSSSNPRSPGPMSQEHPFPRFVQSGFIPDDKRLGLDRSLGLRPYRKSPSVPLEMPFRSKTRLQPSSLKRRELWESGHLHQEYPASCSCEILPIWSAIQLPDSSAWYYSGNPQGELACTAKIAERPCDVWLAKGFCN